VVNGLQNAAIPFSHFILANDRQPFDVIEVFRVELDVLLERASCPAIKLIEFHKHQELAVLFDQLLNRGQKRLVVSCRSDTLRAVCRYRALSVPLTSCLSFPGSFDHSAG
jgi:hypothetical protein